MGRAYLCDLDIVYLELCVWVRLLGVEHLLYGDWSEGVFAICSLSGRSIEGRRRMGLSMSEVYLSGGTLASTLRTSHETSSACPTLSSIGRRRVAATVICKDKFLAAAMFDLRSLLTHAQYLFRPGLGGRTLGVL